MWLCTHMWKCAFMYLCVWKCIPMCICICICVYICACIVYVDVLSMWMCTFVYVHTHRVPANMSLCTMSACDYVTALCMWVFVGISMYTRIYAYSYCVSMYTWVNVCTMCVHVIMWVYCACVWFHVYVFACECMWPCVCSHVYVSLARGWQLSCHCWFDLWPPAGW